MTIDFYEADSTILTLACAEIGQMYIHSRTLLEVRSMTRDGCVALGLTLVEPTVHQALAAAQTRGSLSFSDHLCLVIARDNGWTCVTNDGRLRRECTAEGVGVLWGLEVLAVLVETKALPTARAESIAQAIHELNPLHINQRVLRRFLNRIGRH